MTDTSRNIPRIAFVSALFGILAAVVAWLGLHFCILGAILIGLLVALIVAIFCGWGGLTASDCTATARLKLRPTAGTEQCSKLRPQVLHLLRATMPRQLLPREPRMQCRSAKPAAAKAAKPAAAKAAKPLLRVRNLLLQRKPAARKLPSLLLRNRCQSRCRESASALRNRGQARCCESTKAQRRCRKTSGSGQSPCWRPGRPQDDQRCWPSA